jgi:flagellar basal-body rod protein FlgB
MEIKSIDLIKKVMDYLVHRNDLLSSNISNATTPNYKRLDISFKDELEKYVNARNKDDSGISLKTVDERHISGKTENQNMAFKTVAENSTYQNNNGNNVNIDMEMLESLKNTEQYSILAKKVAGTYSKIRSMFKDLQ